MAIASLSNVEKHFGKKVLFEKAEMAIFEGERVGFIGDNGTGKSTLFKMLMGQVQPDVGVVRSARNPRRIPGAEPEFDPESTVMDEAELGFAELHDLSHKMRDSNTAWPTPLASNSKRCWKNIRTYSTSSTWPADTPGSTRWKPHSWAWASAARHGSKM